MATFFIESVDDALLTEICQLFSGGQNSYTRASILTEGQAATPDQRHPAAQRGDHQASWNPGYLQRLCRGGR